MRNVFAFAFVLALGTLMACAGSSVTEPSPGGPPPSSVVLPPVFAFPGKGEVPVGAVFNEGDEIEIMVQTLGNGGTLAIAFVLSRDGDGGTATVYCNLSSGSGGGTGRTTLAFQDRFYAWAKGHVLNGVMLQADLEDPKEVWRIHGCYFFDGVVTPIGLVTSAPISFDPVRFDKATKRTDYELNWRVN